MKIRVQILVNSNIGLLTKMYVPKVQYRHVRSASLSYFTTPYYCNLGKTHLSYFWTFTIIIIKKRKLRVLKKCILSFASEYILYCSCIALHYIIFNCIRMNSIVFIKFYIARWLYLSRLLFCSIFKISLMILHNFERFSRLHTASTGLAPDKSIWTLNWFNPF